MMEMGDKNGQQDQGQWKREPQRGKLEVES